MIHDLFPDTDPATQAAKFEDYKKTLDSSLEKSDAGKAKFDGPMEIYNQGGGAVEAMEASIATLGKSFSSEQMASLRGELEKLKGADINKDISLTSPVSTGLVPYDLEAPSKKIFPTMTPFRNRVPRVKGQGTAREFRKITGISGSGTGVGLFNPGIADNTTATFGGVTLNRPPKISYAGSKVTRSYVQMGASDSVTWSAEFAGLGFEDMRQLSQTSLLYASMLADENVIAFGRGTASGYLGALAAPAAPTVTVRTAGAGETGNTANIANYYIYVTAITPFGESPASSVLATTNGLAAVTGKVLDVGISPVTGALGYNVYGGPTTGAANVFKLGTASFTGTATGLGLAPFTVNFAGAGTGGAVNAGAAAPTADTTAYANNFDGIYTLCADTGSGYQGYVNGKLSTSNPGAEWQTAFATMFDANKANPDEIWLNGNDRKQLSESIHGGASTPPGYRVTIGSDQGESVKIGTMVTTIVNEVTGKDVACNVYAWAPQGQSVILSWNLPFPQTEVPSCWNYPLVQDYMSVNWPVMGLTYDASTYWYGAMICYAPTYQGFIGGIQKA